MQNLIKRCFILSTSLLAAGIAQADNPFTPDSQPTGWLSTPIVSLFDVSSGSEHFYRIAFYKDTWSGNVFAHDISKYGVIDDTNGPWGDVILNAAATKLDALDWDTGRKIATNGGALRWANLTAAEQSALGTEDVLKYIRGDRTNEEPNGFSWRKREYVLGDILHANIVGWDNGTTSTLFVGANDGMLHAFDATNGNERWAYVPSMLITKLAELKAKPYVHTHYVDGSISVANVTVSGAQKTYLIGALGAGGKGLYALDVTSHTAADEAAVAGKVLWEIIPNGSFTDLGYSYGTPQITRLPNGTAVVIFGNGYMSDTGKATLYVVNATTGSLISAIPTNSGSTISPNGLSSPTLYDANFDGAPEYAYAGDLDGHMWKFDLVNNSVSLLYTTSPVQSITSAPAVDAHPLGGQIVNFATGRMLSSGDRTDSSQFYVYGVWDGAPAANDTMLVQTLTQSSFDGVPVMTVSSNAPDWTAGAGHHKGWKVALRQGERVVGDKPIHNAGRFYFITTNPVEPLGKNYLIELVALTGGSPLGPIFDLNTDGSYNSSDLAANGGIPVGKYLGAGIFSQPRLIHGDGLTTTLYVFHPDLPIDLPTPPIDPGVSGGHFDFDIYYYGPPSTVTEPVAGENYEIVYNYCKKTKDVAKKLDDIFKGCEENASAGYTFLTDYVVGSVCKADADPNKVEYYHELTCNETEYITYTTTDYKKIKHVHEYDDKYNVTGVNMQNASAAEFNLVNALPDGDVEFKILILNQYLNPAAEVAFGAPTFQSVKDYGGQSSAASAADVLALAPTYTRNTMTNFIYNLPLDAFKNKDWWGDGGELRSGLIPTQTGCVNGVDTDGTSQDPGPNGERFNGALAFQLIKPDTPADQLELNGPDARYGWRVKLAAFKDYVLAEYSTFWHHPNGACYGDVDWIPDPPEDFDFSDKTTAPAPGSEDPRGGTFGFGLAIINITTVTSEDGLTVTTTWTYNDGSTHVRTETTNEDGSVTVHQVFRDGTEETVTYFPDSRGGEPGYVDPNTGSPIEDDSTRPTGRQSWRDIVN